MNASEVTDEDLKACLFTPDDYLARERVAAAWNLCESRRWVSVKERLPTDTNDYLVAEGSESQAFDCYSVACYHAGDRCWYEQSTSNKLDVVKFWQPIHPPTGEAR